MPSDFGLQFIRQARSLRGRISRHLISLGAEVSEREGSRVAVFLFVFSNVWGSFIPASAHKMEKPRAHRLTIHKGSLRRSSAIRLRGSLRQLFQHGAFDLLRYEL